MSPKTVLISGASIAGPTLAYWLRHNGFVPTIVERAPRPRPGGQAIDIRGKALVVMERMGLIDRACALRTQMKGVSLQDEFGKEIWRSEEKTFTGGRFDNDDIELLRDDLSNLLLGTLPDVEILFGDWGRSVPSGSLDYYYLYCSTDRFSRCDAAVQNLSHSESLRRS